METIAYIAPSSIGTIEAQIDMVRPYVSNEQYIRVDRPKKPGDPIPRIERDFVFAHMLRSAADNKDGKPDRLVVPTVAVLGDRRDEVTELFNALTRLGVPLVALADGLDGDKLGTEYVLKWIKALERAEGRWQRAAKAARPNKKPRKGLSTGGRPKAISQHEIDDMIRLKEVERMTWPKIEAHFAALGITIKQPTLRAYYARAKAK